MSEQPALFQNLISRVQPNQLCSEEVNIHLLNKPLSITTLFRPTDSFKIKELHYIRLKSYLTENTMCFHKKDQSVNFV